MCGHARPVSGLVNIMLSVEEEGFVWRQHQPPFGHGPCHDATMMSSILRTEQGNSIVASIPGRQVCIMHFVILMNVGRGGKTHTRPRGVRVEPGRGLGGWDR